MISIQKHSINIIIPLYFSFLIKWSINIFDEKCSGKMPYLTWRKKIDKSCHISLISLTEIQLNSLISVSDKFKTDVENSTIQKACYECYNTSPYLACNSKLSVVSDSTLTLSLNKCRYFIGSPRSR